MKSGGMRLEPIMIGKDSKIEDLLLFYMGKNTQTRQQFIIENLRLEKEEIQVYSQIDS